MGFILSLLGRIPSIWLIVAGAVAIIGFGTICELRGESRGETRIQAKWDKERLAILQAHDKALADEIATHNAQQAATEANHAQAQQDRVVAEADAASAVAALDAAGVAQRRLRDKLATSDLAIKSALESAGATGLCAPAIEASNLRGVMLQRLDELAGRIGAAAAGVGKHADDSWLAAKECAADYDAVRAR